MKNILTQNLVVVTVSLLLGILFAPALTSAATLTSLTGTAGVLNTGGSLDFDNFNSNAVVNPDTGAVSGYVWSEDIGWIDFSNNQAVNSVYVDLSDGSVSGLAYALNTGGHIDFTNVNSNVVWNQSSGTLSGYGWSEDLGWIDFSETLLTLAETGQSILPVLFLAPSVVFAFFINRKQLDRKNFFRSMSYMSHRN